MPITWPCRLRGFAAYFGTELTNISKEKLSTTNNMKAIAQKLTGETS